MMSHAAEFVDIKPKHLPKNSKRSCVAVVEVGLLCSAARIFMLVKLRDASQ